jgi:hypothetical protein
MLTDIILDMILDIVILLDMTVGGYYAYRRNG